MISTNPTGGTATWSKVSATPGVIIDAVSCPTASFCVAGNEAGRVMPSTNPTGGSGAWTTKGVVDLTRSCRSRVPTPRCAPPLTDLGQIFPRPPPAWEGWPGTPSHRRHRGRACCPSRARRRRSAPPATTTATCSPRASRPAASAPGVPNNVDAGNWIGAISCSTISLCAAVIPWVMRWRRPIPRGGLGLGGGPGGLPRRRHNNWTGRTCTASGLCAMVDEAGDIVTSTRRRVGWRHGPRQR